MLRGPSLSADEFYNKLQLEKPETTIILNDVYCESANCIVDIFFNYKSCLLFIRKTYAISKKGKAFYIPQNKQRILYSHKIKLPKNYVENLLDDPIYSFVFTELPDIIDNLI